jgi:hypothetical protein
MWQSQTYTTLYLRLTDVNGHPTWINANRILVVDTHCVGSRVILDSHNPTETRVHVKETPDQIMALLHPAEAKK